MLVIGVYVGHDGQATTWIGVGVGAGVGPVVINSFSLPYTTVSPFTLAL